MYLHLHTFYHNRNGQNPPYSVSIITHIYHLCGQVAIKLAYGFLKYSTIYDYPQLLIKFPLHRLGYGAERNNYSLES